MSSRHIARLCVLATILSLASLAARAQDAVSVFSPYRLIDPAPLVGAQPSADWRLLGQADLGERHQLLLSSPRTGLSVREDSFWSPAYTSYGLAPAGARLDPARATYRYTVLERPAWSWRVGVTTNLQELSGLRLSLSGERARFGSLPLLHVGGDGRVWRGMAVGFDADGLMTPRGHAFELGLRASYDLAPNLAVYGRYRLSESAGEAEEFYGTGLSNSANVGLRFRF